MTSLQVVALLAVAIAWWKGPQISRLRIPLTILLILNAVALVIFAVYQRLGDNPPWQLMALGQAIDRGSDVFLLWVVLRLPPMDARSRLLRRMLLGLAVTAYAVLAVFFLMGDEGMHPSPVRALHELPLFLAIAAMTLSWVRLWPVVGKPEAWSVVLLSAGLSARFADILTLYVYPRHARIFDTGDIGLWVSDWSGIIAFWIFAAGIVFLTSRFVFTRRRSERLQTGTLILAPAVGALMGMAMKGDVSALSAFAFTLGLVRPGFTGAAMLALPNLEARNRAIKSIVAVSLIAVGSGVGIALGAKIWGLDAPAVALVAVAFALLLVPLAFSVRLRREPTTPESNLASVVLEADRVRLRHGWQERARANQVRFAELDAGAQTALTKLFRWQRILLALYASPGSPGEYASSTPGLHELTHCPYSQIGPEISRMNKRSGKILAELGLSPTPAVGTSQPLARSSMGSVDGLSSKRVKTYALTEDGRRVAEAILQKMSLDKARPPSLLGVLGEQLEGYPTDLPPNQRYTTL